METQDRQNTQTLDMRVQNSIQNTQTLDLRVQNSIFCRFSASVAKSLRLLKSCRLNLPPGLVPVSTTLRLWSNLGMGPGSRPG